MQITEETVKEILEQIERLRRENLLLQQRMDGLLRRLYGKSSEKIDPNQLTFRLPDPERSSGSGSLNMGVRSFPAQSRS